MKYGKIYGVGVGPGAPDLMTLRSVKVINEADVIAIPQSNPHVRSVAWRIVEPNLFDNPAQERMFLTFAMSKDPAVTGPCWDTALSKIGERLKEGKNVAFISEGDPLFYSTFNYLMQSAKELWPDCEIEVVPAVSSIAAVPSVLKIPAADGQERVAVVPAAYGLEELPDILRMFDTVFLMKVSSVMPQLVKILESENLLDKAFYVSKATMDGEIITTDLDSIKNDRCDYFSMIMVARQNRNGVLFSGVTETMKA